MAGGTGHMIRKDDTFGSFRPPSRDTSGSSVDDNTFCADSTREMSGHRLHPVEYFSMAYGGDIAIPGEPVACIDAVWETAYDLSNFGSFPPALPSEEKSVIARKLFRQFAPEAVGEFPPDVTAPDMNDAIPYVLEAGNLQQMTHLMNCGRVGWR